MLWNTSYCQPHFSAYLAAAGMSSSSRFSSRETNDVHPCLSEDWEMHIWKQWCFWRITNYIERQEPSFLHNKWVLSHLHPAHMASTSSKVCEMLQSSDEFNGHGRVTQSQATVVGTSSLVKPACKLKWPTAAPAFTLALSDHLHQRFPRISSRPTTFKQPLTAKPSTFGWSACQLIQVSVILIYIDLYGSAALAVYLSGTGNIIPKFPWTALHRHLPEDWTSVPSSL